MWGICDTYQKKNTLYSTGADSHTPLDELPLFRNKNLFSSFLVFSNQREVKETL